MGVAQGGQMADDLAQILRAATGAVDRLQVTVVAEGDTAPVVHELKYPYAVIGRGEGCDIILPGGEVSFRHAYLQVIEGRVFCVDLASRNGVEWEDGPRKYGWVVPDEPLRIGPYTLRVQGDETRDRSLRDALSDLNPLERYHGQAGPMPRVDLEFQYETATQPTWSVNRLLTLVGRGPVCKVRFDTPMVSGVHCSLLLTRHGLWAIDLLGRGGIKVDDELVQVMPLQSGDVISVASYQIGVFYDEPAELAAADRQTDNAAEGDTSMDDLESAFLQDAPVPDAAPPPPQDPSAKADGLEWLGTIFKIERQGSTLVVIPVVDGCGFRYQQLHVEANSLQRKFEMKSFGNLVVDLCALNYFGSELIGVLIRLARAVTNSQGRVAFCSPSAKMLEVLESMRLNKLWPIFPSREDAIRHVMS